MAVWRSENWIDLPTDISIAELMNHNVENTKDSKIIYEDSLNGRTATYAGFRRDYGKLAYWLKTTRGLLPEQVVSIVSPSCVGYLQVMHAVWCAGGIVSPINNALHPSELAYAIDIIEPTFLVVHSSALSAIESALKRVKMSWMPQILVMSHDRADGESIPLKLGDAPLLKPFSLHGKDARKVCAAILLSSGTTGPQKAVMLSHFNLVSTCLQLRDHNPDNWRSSMREIFFPPLSHVYALYVAGTMCCWLGAYVCLVPRFELGLYCKLMHDRQATLARLVPPVAKQLAEGSVVRKYHYPSLEYFSCSAAPLNHVVASKLQKVFPHVKICQTYGCTELSGAIVQSGVRDKDLSIVGAGTPISNVEIRFWNEKLQDAGAKGPGEILIRGPNLMMGLKGNMTDYYESLIDGDWYRTGDIGHVDDNGYLVVFDRVKDMIKYKGFQVSPTELEKVIAAHPAVNESAVCSIYSEEDSTELPRAFVILREGLVGNYQLAEDIKHFVAEQVAGYKRLRGGVEFLDELPKNPTGKVLRRLLRQRGHAERGGGNGGPKL